MEPENVKDLVQLSSSLFSVSEVPTPEEIPTFLLPE